MRRRRRSSGGRDREGVYLSRYACICMHISWFININVIHLKLFVIPTIFFKTFCCCCCSFFFILNSFQSIILYEQYIYNHRVEAGRISNHSQRNLFFSQILFSIFFFFFIVLLLLLLLLLHYSISYNFMVSAKSVRHFRSHRIFQWGFAFEWKIQTTSFLCSNYQ